MQEDIMSDEFSDIKHKGSTENASMGFEARTFSFDEEVVDEAPVILLPPKSVQPIKENLDNYQPFVPSKAHIMVDDPDEVEPVEVQQRFSPKFDTEDSKDFPTDKFEDSEEDLNTREDIHTPHLPQREPKSQPIAPKHTPHNPSEDANFQKILLTNIETLELSLQKAQKRIIYLEEYNAQLTKSRSDLYSEKEDLIKRSIEFEYLQKALEENK